VLRAQDAPASERHITPVAPPYTAHPETSRYTRMRMMRTIYCVSPPISGLFLFFSCFGGFVVSFVRPVPRFVYTDRSCGLY
jgi:hypothetical protein